MSCSLDFFETQKSSGSSAPMILVINKIDCAPSTYMEAFKTDDNLFSKHVFTCAVTGQGISELESAILQIMGLDQIPAGGRRWTVNQVSSIFICFLCLVLSSAFRETITPYEI